MMTTDDMRERVSRLEGGYEHLATKADLAKLEAQGGSVGGAHGDSLRAGGCAL